MVAAEHQRRLPDFSEARQRIMRRDHVDALQPNLTVVGSREMRCRSFNPRCYPLRTLTRVSWGEEKKRVPGEQSVPIPLSRHLAPYLELALGEGVEAGKGGRDGQRANRMRMIESHVLCDGPAGRRAGLSSASR
jgi:hypothetical protein